LKAILISIYVIVASNRNKSKEFSQWRHYPEPFTRWCR
jgi:hypothetical protein